MKWPLAAILIAVPSLAPGHGSEYLGAKLSWTAGGAAQLEISADYGENPLLADEAQARTALIQSLEIQTPGGWKPLDELSPFSWEKRDQPDRGSPLPTDESGKPHRILTAHWSWSPSAEMDELQFRGHPQLIQSLVFWLDEPNTSAEKTRWSMLLAGEMTPRIPIARPVSTLWVWATYLMLALVTALTFSVAPMLRDSR